MYKRLCNTGKKKTEHPTIKKNMEDEEPPTTQRRRLRAEELRSRYPDHVPVLVGAGEKAPPLKRERFLIPGELTCADLCYVVRRHVGPGLRKDQAIFLLCRNGREATSSTPSHVAVSGTQTMRDVHDKYADADGFLNVTYCVEHVFG